ncbi:branched-chain amino acid ABC transporter permease [Georgenia sp. EYE_87]|uniref:branched-chain amino acid ABC transporter permease n=1 Tax=Georgenia sp. EYE_87 TaxID=2853448 RepID=UPI002003196E|nr:branched-chain amino acid ABC transporter permease [Georgenia sp. EYE_87]MCK6210064.1 branched-chain amino acid ABC transporter permease [Georgenia sp. EYE_87]
MATETRSARQARTTRKTGVLSPHGAVIAMIVIVVLLGALTLAASQLPSMWGHMIVMTLIWACLATAWNVVGGFAGQISLGHAGFFGIGAYASTLLYIDYGISPWFGLVVAVVLGALTAWAIGVPSFRLRGPYFALVTLAFGLIVFHLSVHLRDLTYGQVGVPVPYDPSFGNMIFPDRWQYVILAGAFLVVCLAVSQVIARSRIGYRLAAVRDDEDAARALGVNTGRVKLVAAVFSGAMAAGVGTIYSQYILFLSPDSVFGITVSIEALALAVVGGAGFVFGPLVGAAVLVPISHIVLAQFGGDAPGVHTLVYSVVLIVVVLLVPGGLWSLVERVKLRFRARRGVPVTVGEVEQVKEGELV